MAAMKRGDGLWRVGSFADKYQDSGRRREEACGRTECALGSVLPSPYRVEVNVRVVGLSLKLLERSECFGILGVGSYAIAYGSGGSDGFVKLGGINKAEEQTGRARGDGQGLAVWENVRWGSCKTRVRE